MYFLLQSCSGHSNNTGDIAHGDVMLLHFLVEICTFSPVIGLTTLCVPSVPLLAMLLIFALFTLLEFITLPLVLLLVLPLPPFTGEGDSSFDLRFSGRGGKKATGDVEGVMELTLVLVPLDELPVVVVEVVVVFAELESAVVVVARLPRPFVPPFRNLLCIELRVSVKLLRSLTGNNAEPRLRLARPFGARESKSSIGESQNRGGAQSCFVQSIRVPT